MQPIVGICVLRVPTRRGGAVWPALGGGGRRAGLLVGSFPGVGGPYRLQGSDSGGPPDLICRRPSFSDPGVMGGLFGGDHRQHGLHRCNLLALAGALDGLQGEYVLAVVDGFDVQRPDLRASRLVGGDYKSAVVAAASVVAKVVRDRLMRAIAPSYPEYGFDEHVGYGTDRHRAALRRYGPCFHHRLSFQGVGTTQLGLWEA